MRWKTEVMQGHINYEQSVRALTISVITPAWHKKLENHYPRRDGSKSY